MEPKVLYGTCSWEQLVKFSRIVVDGYYPELPKQALVIPVSKRRQKHHRVYNSNGQIISGEIVKDRHSTAMFYNNREKVHKVRWVSLHRNEIIAIRTESGEYDLYFTQRSWSFYERFLEQAGISLKCA